MIAGSGLNERYGLNELPVYKNRLRHGAVCKLPTDSSTVNKSRLEPV